MIRSHFDWDDDDEDEDEEYEEEEEEEEDELEDYGLDAEEDDEEDEEEEEDDEEVFGRIERAFRQQRARIRVCEEIHELRTIRTEHVVLAESAAREAERIRARDLVELVDDRITDLKAQRIARRH